MHSWHMETLKTSKSNKKLIKRKREFILSRYLVKERGNIKIIVKKKCLVWDFLNLLSTI